MLSRQNLGWYHHTRLKTIVGGKQHREERHHGLSATHIALQEAVHLHPRHAVVANIAYRLLLTFGQGKWKMVVVEGVELLADAREYKAVSRTRSQRAVCLNVELYAEQLVKFESELRLLQLLGRLRKVYVVECLFKRDESVCGA